MLGAIRRWVEDVVLIARESGGTRRANQEQPSCWLGDGVGCAGAVFGCWRKPSNSSLQATRVKRVVEGEQEKVAPFLPAPSIAILLRGKSREDRLSKRLTASVGPSSFHYCTTRVSSVSARRVQTVTGAGRKRWDVWETVTGDERLPTLTRASQSRARLVRTKPHPLSLFLLKCTR